MSFETQIEISALIAIALAFVAGNALVDPRLITMLREHLQKLIDRIDGA